MLFGLPRFASSFSLKIAETEKEPFVEAARSVGAGRVRLFFHHILPQHRETIALNFVGESIATLNLIGQLGIFDMYIGGTKTTPAPLLFHSQTHEWAGLVGSYRGKLFSSDWWLLGVSSGGLPFSAAQPLSYIPGIRIKNPSPNLKEIHHEYELAFP
jgi:peptide/nickel transport system permease protein